jgi:predicted phosphatase
MSSNLFEGGNIWPESSSIDHAIIGNLLAELAKYLKKPGLTPYPIGSGATPTPGRQSGDLDIMVDLDQVQSYFKTTDSKDARIALEKYLQSQGLQTRRIAVTVHILLPYKSKFYQVDIKVVRNAARVSAFHHHTIPAGSPYKGIHKQMMMNALATSQGYLWSPDEGLYLRNSEGKKDKFLSDDLNKIAKVLIGPSANAMSLGSVESILEALPENKRDEIFALASGSHSWQNSLPKPTTVNEWFRTLLDRL